MLTQKVGFEAEVFVVTPSKHDLVIAGERDLPHDDFVLLGEIRGECGETPAETTTNFLSAYYSFLDKVSKKSLDVDLSGSKWIDHPFYAKIMKLMGTKEWPECKNIYGIDISESSDIKMNPDTGKIHSHAVSCGFHIHFSSFDLAKETIEQNTEIYSPIDIPLSLGKMGEDPITDSWLHLYRRIPVSGSKTTKKDITAKASRITKPVIKHFVESLDKEILPGYSVDPSTKYRQPGFYELKSWGFEYRSLPFTKEVLDNLLSIAQFSFSLLNDL